VLIWKCIEKTHLEKGKLWCVNEHALGKRAAVLVYCERLNKTTPGKSIGLEK
jgi:hypothetical protein